jgi:hypothetical protein
MGSLAKALPNGTSPEGTRKKQAAQRIGEVRYATWDRKKRFPPPYF